MSTDKKEEKSGLTIFLQMAMIPFLFVYAVLARGYVLSILWSWFIVKQFSVKEINIETAFGLVVFVTFFTAGLKPEKSSDDFTNIVIRGLITPWLMLGSAYIVKFWVF